jgi:hypothetical protein
MENLSSVRLSQSLSSPLVIQVERSLSLVRAAPKHIDHRKKISRRTVFYKQHISDFIFSLSNSPATERKSEIEERNENSSPSRPNPIQSTNSLLTSRPSSTSIMLKTPTFLILFPIEGYHMWCKREKTYHPRPDNPGRVPGIFCRISLPRRCCVLRKKNSK